MRGQIEREESSPTIATLWKIANGFDTSFSSFLENSQLDSKKNLRRTGRVQQLNSIDEKIRILPLFPFDKQLNCEIFIIELLPGCEHVSSKHQPGVIEHIIVVDGAMEVLLDGSWQTLHKGEGFRFNADQPHGYRNSTQQNACFHNIIHY